ncbi:MAG: EamA family transporter [Anaerolineaceae bacterium]|nr:EamA family transporter [Anaerolineaceae bacterium]
MNYQLIALASAFIFSLVILIGKYITTHIVEDHNSFFFWTYTPVLPFVFLIPLRFGFQLTQEMILPLLICTLLLTIGQYFFARGIFTVDASVISPLFQLQSGFILIFATFFLGEKHELLTYSFLLLMLLGTILVSITDKTHLKGFLQIGVLYIIGMQIFHAGANVAVGFALRYTTTWQVLFYTFVLNSIISGIFILVKKVPITFQPAKIKWLFARSFLLLIATSLLYTAFETNISVSSAIGLLSSPIVFSISVILGLFFPSFLEKQSPKTYLIRAAGMLMILYSAWNIMQY